MKLERIWYDGVSNWMLGETLNILNGDFSLGYVQSDGKNSCPDNNKRWNEVTTGHWKTTRKNVIRCSQSMLNFDIYQWVLFFYLRNPM